jgi:hypothetical protein
LTTGRDLAALSRSGELGDIAVKLPNLRMPPLAVLSETEQAAARADVERGLKDSRSAAALLGDGLLGRLFPSVFGDHSAGGIVGRPQHGGHDFDLHVHTLHVLNRVRSNPEFQNLSPKDQANVLWAALMHDVGKQPGKADPDHEWVSANVSWGVLGALGYSPSRIQRIANLISRHGEMSFDPSEKTSARLADEKYLQDLAVFYRHPSSVKQLSVLNEADIRSIDAGSRHWTSEVQQELRAISQKVGAEGKRINQVAIPLLTTQLPQRYGLVQLKGPYAVLAHASTHMDKAFLEQLSIIESPEYSVSASLLTDKHKKLYYDESSVVALVSGPPEHISQIFRSNLGTGRAVDWKGHVELATRWVEKDNGLEFAREIDQRIRRFAGGGASNNLQALQEAWRKLTQFDSLDELHAAHGSDSTYAQIHHEIVRALTTDQRGMPSKEHNEIKLNNPTLVGLGILRRGRQVSFEQLHDRQFPSSLLSGQEKPDWLSTSAAVGPQDNKVVIPEVVWKTAQKRRLPIVILDP